MTINIGSDLTRPLPDDLSEPADNPGGGAAGGGHVSECVSTVNVSGSGKKHIRGRISDRMHSLTSGACPPVRGGDGSAR